MYKDCLVHVILVKEANEKLQICIDFINLNKIYPKNSYPLLPINQLVDSTTGYKLFGFLDVYSSYH